MSELTPEQLSADAQAAEQKKQADKAAADRLKAEKKAESEKLKAQKKADADAAKAAAKEKADKKAAADAEKAAAKAKKEADKKAAAEAKAAAKPAKVQMPEQNGIRRPKPDGLCGQAWATMDRLSSQLGQPVPISTLLEATNRAGLSEGNVRAEYARWRKFNGVTGRVTLPTTLAT